MGGDARFGGGQRRRHHDPQGQRVTESGPNRSGAGRQVAVYKKTIEKSAVTYAKALEICTVAWDAADNKITTTTWAASGAGVFGQDTPSTTASDYTVVLIGPRVSRNTDLSTVPAWCYVGFVTGAGAGNPPAVFDVTGQNLMNIPLSDFTQITRYENVPPDRLKIDVKALAGEVGVDQIRVTKLGTGVTFSVDEAGNTLAGTLRLNHTDPTIDIENTDAGVDQKNWRWVTGTESLSLRSFDDAWVNAMTAIQIIKDAGGANPYRIENMVFWADDHISLSSSGEIRVSDLVPSGNNWCGSAAKRFLGFYGMGLDLEISSGNVMIRLNDSGADPNEGIFKICNNDGQLCILSENDAGAIRDLMVFNKSDGDYRVTKVSIYSFDEFWIGGANKIGLGGSPSGISAIECFLDVIPDIDVSLDLGDWTWGATDTGRRWSWLLAAEVAAIKASEPSIYLRKTGIAANEKTWRFYVDAGDDLVLETMDDAPASGITIFRVTRGVGTAIGSMAFNTNLISYGALTIGEAANEWGGGYFSGSLRCLGCHVDGDSGGVAGTTTLTSGWSGVSSGAGSIVMNSANPGTNTGWISIRVGAALKWIPYWDTNAP
jgi:hypothetical protein